MKESKKKQEGKKKRFAFHSFSFLPPFFSQTLSHSILPPFFLITPTTHVFLESVNTVTLIHGALHTRFISTHNQHRCKCGKRITVDHVDFECTFVKALWQVFAQAIGLNMKTLTPQTQQPFLVATLFHSRFRKRKDTWCDMTHSFVYYQAWVRWFLCNDIIPKAIPLSQRHAQRPKLAEQPNTKRLADLTTTHTL